MKTKDGAEIIATALIALAALGLGLVLLNVRDNVAVFGGFLVCLTAISVGGLRLWTLLNRADLNNKAAEDAE